MHPCFGLPFSLEQSERVSVSGSFNSVNVTHGRLVVFATPS
jgi:hypothetical protein